MTDELGMRVRPEPIDRADDVSHGDIFNAIARPGEHAGRTGGAGFGEGTGAPSMFFEWSRP
jgi:hypothetical protein